MHGRKAIGFLPLFSAFVMLATCQLQLNKVGNALDLRVTMPGRTSAGTSSARSLAGGTGVILTITTLAGAQWETSNMLGINGNSVSYTFNLPPSGSYLASAELFGGTGNLISQASTPFTVPVGTSPVTLSVSSGQVTLSYLDEGQSTNISNYSGEGYSQAYFNDSSTPVVFQVTNADSSNTLYPFGSSPVTITDTYNEFVVTSQLPSTPIPPGGSSEFAIECATYNYGIEETVTLRTSDPSNTPFVFQVGASVS